LSLFTRTTNSTQLAFYAPIALVKEYSFHPGQEQNRNTILSQMLLWSPFFPLSGEP